MRTKVQLFLFHFAGGNCYSYDFLKKHLANSNLEIHSLELPGRGKRYDESLIRDKSIAIDDYFSQIRELRNNQPYFIFGHSMGATLGLSVTHKLEAFGDSPSALLVSGNPGPGIKKTKEEEKPKRYLLEDNEFKEALREFVGIPEEILVNDELYSYFEPILRVDFEIIEKDDFSEKVMLVNVPIIAMMGDKEEKVDQISNWKKFTTNDFFHYIFNGEHFFIHNYPKEIAIIINEKLNKLETTTL